MRWRDRELNSGRVCILGATKGHTPSCAALALTAVPSLPTPAGTPAVATALTATGGLQQASVTFTSAPWWSKVSVTDPAAVLPSPAAPEPGCCHALHACVH